MSTRSESDNRLPEPGADAALARRYRLYFIAAAAAAALTTAIYCLYLNHQVDSFYSIHGRLFEIFKGIAAPGTWPETLHGSFNMSPSRTLALIGPLCNYMLIFPLDALFGVNAFTVISCCLFLAAVNYCGIYPLLLACRHHGIKNSGPLILALAMILNPFLLLKYSWEPLLSFGLVTVPAAYYMQLKNRRALWMLLVASLSLMHPFGIVTSGVWFAFEALRGGKDIRPWAFAGFGCLAAVFLYRILTLGPDVILLSESSWLAHEFGNTKNSVLSLVATGRADLLLDRLKNNGLELFFLIACAGFFFSFSKKFLILLLPEFFYILAGIDGIQNGSVPTFAGLIFAGIVDGFRTGEGIFPERFKRAAPPVSLVCSVVLLVLFSRGYIIEYQLMKGQDFQRETESLMTENRRRLLDEAIAVIEPGKGVICATNARIAAYLSRSCNDTVSIHSLFPMDLDTFEHVRSDIEPDWLLVDFKMLELPTPSISGEPNRPFQLLQGLVDIMNSGGYDLIFGREGLVVYRKKPENKGAGSP